MKPISLALGEKNNSVGFVLVFAEYVTVSMLSVFGKSHRILATCSDLSPSSGIYILSL